MRMALRFFMAALPPNPRIATYSRVSTAHRDQKPEVQVEELKRYCASRGWAIAHEIVDHGYSGGTDERPGFKKLLSLAQSRQIDVIVVVKLDRLFRSLRHLVTTLEEFNSLGISFVAVRDSVDWSTPGGRLFIQILGCLGEFERSLLVERTLMGLAHAKERGKILGRPRKHLEESILQMRSNGLSYRQIAKTLGCSMGSIRRALTAPKTPSK